MLLNYVESLPQGRPLPGIIISAIVNTYVFFFPSSVANVPVALYSSDCDSNLLHLKLSVAMSTCFWSSSVVELVAHYEKFAWVYSIINY